MRRFLLNWCRRQRRPLILSVIFISAFELWKHDLALLGPVDEDAQGVLEQTLERSVTMSDKFHNFLLLEDDSQLDTEHKRHHRALIVRAPLMTTRQPATRAPLDDHNSDIVVDTSGPVVNPHPFSYVINCPNLCRGVDVFLLNYVHTAVDHFARRARIRKTWAQQSHYPNTTIRTVFFVGLSDKADWLQYALQYEASLYNDIVQENFLDTYRNLSYKGVAALKWIKTYCSQAAYIMKCDDDVFVNMFALLKHLTELYAYNYRRRLIICLLWRRMHVLRHGKWSIPRDQLPDDLYPVYCSGMGFVLTTDAAVAMYRVSYYVEFQWVDDAYITGFLPRALNGAVNHVDMGRAYCGAAEMAVYWHQTEWYKYIFTHVHDEQLYRRTWHSLVDIASRKAIPSPDVIRPGVLAEYYIPKRTLFPQLEKRRQQQAALRKKLMMVKKKEQVKQRDDSEDG